jgi:hypothetical protein
MIYRVLLNHFQIFRILRVLQIDQVKDFYYFILNKNKNKENNTNWKLNQTESSLKIFANSFKSNQTYQFMVYINNRLNSTLKNYGYLFIHIQNTFSYRISIR